MFLKFGLGFSSLQETLLSKARVFAFPKLKESLALYLTNFLRSFSLSLPGIFLPIFILTLTNKPAVLGDVFLNNVFWVLVYYFIYTVSVSLANIFLSDFLFRKLGFRSSILLSMFFLIGMIASFILAEEKLWLVLLGSVFMALAVHFYWIPFHVFFVRKANDDGNFGNESASLLLTTNIAGALGPLAAGLILKFSGFSILFLLTAFMLFLSSLPIMFWVNESRHGEHKLRKIFGEYLSNPKFRKLNLAFAGIAIDSLLFEIFWPILLFFVLRDYVELGGLVTFSTILSAVILVWIGRLLENNKAGFWEKGSVMVNALISFFRVFTVLPIGLLAIDVAYRFNGKIYGAAILSESYNKIKSLGVSESDFIIYRETIIHLSQIFGLILAAVMIFGLGNWKLVFLVPALSSLLAYFLFI